MGPVVCVVERVYRRVRSYFESLTDFEFVSAGAQESAMAEAVAEHNAVAAVLATDKYTDQLYDALPKGGIIARFGVGHDGIDKTKATKAGIIVTNTPGVLDESVAEHAIWLIGALARRIAACDAYMKAGQFNRIPGFEVKGKTLLILGCGKIGSRVAEIASKGLGMNVIGYDIASLDAEQLQQKYGIQKLYTQLDDALAQADFISIHISACEATNNLIDSQLLAKMKNTAYVVNTSRGSVIDESALYDAVSSGQIAGAGLDVFQNEPYEPIDTDRDLRKLEQMILTPHIGSSTQEASQNMAETVIANIQSCCRKEYAGMNIVNPEVLKGLQ